MESAPNDAKSWSHLESLIQKAVNGDSKSLNDFIIQSNPDENWREGAIRYLLSTSGNVCDQITSTKIWTVGLIITAFETRQVSELINFFESKWQEFCSLDGSILSDPQREFAVSSGHALIVMICHARSAKGVEYLEQIVQQCQTRHNKEFQSFARLYLSKARLFLGNGV